MDSLACPSVRREGQARESNFEDPPHGPTQGGRIRAVVLPADSGPPGSAGQEPSWLQGAAADQFLPEARRRPGPRRAGEGRTGEGQGNAGQHRAGQGREVRGRAGQGNAGHRSRAEQRRPGRGRVGRAGTARVDASTTCASLKHRGCTTPSETKNQLPREVAVVKYPIA